MNKILLTSLCTMACGALQVVHAQQIQVAGKVSDVNGTAIPDVTVAIKGTNTATSTNSNGLFTLNASQDATLIISAVGYEKQQVKISGRKTLTISLEKEENALDEVMVVAYGTAKKSTFTGSAAVVKNR